MESLSPQSSTSSELEIGDYLFCGHGMEKCDTCQIDHREDNCFTAGVDILGEREPISVEFTFNKDGVPQCKKHKATMCNNCYGFKKQIIKGNLAAKKAKSKIKGSTSNFV